MVPTARPGGAVTVLLRLEGVAALAAGVSVYASLEGGWLFFLLLLLLPDVSMAGYLADDRTGAVVYNAVHTYAATALLGGVAWWMGDVTTGRIAAIWLSHIGMDRALGFGLKRSTGFRDTHLGGLPGGES